MKRTAIRLVASGVLLAAALSHAAAQNAIEAAAKWGLTGTWAIDCKAKPGGNNTVFTYMRQKNALVVKRDFGTDYQSDTSEIVSAILTPDGGIEIAVYFRSLTPPQVRTQRYLKEGGGYRTMFNRDQHDNYSVRDFKFVSNGQPTKVIQRCAR